MMIRITDTNIQDCIIDLAYWTNTVNKDINDPIMNHEVRTGDLAKIKRLCEEYLRAPLIQALRTD